MEKFKNLNLQDEIDVSLEFFEEALNFEYKNFNLTKLANKIKSQAMYRPKPKIYYS